MSASPERFQRLARALDVYEAWEQAGRSPSAEEVLAQHPDLEEVLQPMLAGEPDENPRDGPIGTEFAGFRIEREIGRGAMGVVYAARQIALDRLVALKILPGDARLDARAVARFRRESALLAGLRHPGIVDVLTVGRDRGHEFYAMDLVAGVPLRRVVDELVHDAPETLDGSSVSTTVGALLSRGADVGRGPTGADVSAVWRRGYVEAAVDVVRQVADALHHAHEAGVLHRDVKPSNVLIRADGRAVLTDFGLAREIGRPSLTASGEFAGTPYYASPEQVIGSSERLDRRSDVFSLGVVLYELVTLRRPFEGRTSHEVARAILSREPTDPAMHNRRLPDDLAAIVLKALEKDPARRYRTAAELADDLTAFLDYRPVQARRAGPLEKVRRFCRREPLKAAFVAALLVGVPTIGFLGGFLLARQPLVEAGEAQLRDARIDALLERGAVVLEQHSEEALALFRQALEIDRRHPEAFAFRTIAVARLRSPDDALALLDAAEAERPAAAPMFVRLRAAVLRIARRGAEADAIEGTLAPPEDAIQAFCEGLARIEHAHATGRADDFLASAERFDLAMLLARSPRPIYHHQLAHALGHAGDTRRAARVADAIETLWPDSPVALWWAYYAAQRAAPERARERLRRAIELDPGNAKLHYALGTQLVQSGRFAESVGPLEESIRRDPDYAEAHANLAGALMRLGRPEEALASFDRALELQPDRAMFVANRAQALTSLERAAEAIGELRRALTIDPHEPTALSGLARALLREEGAEACRGFCEEQLSAGVRIEALYQYLAMAEQALGDVDGARGALERGLAQHPDSGRLLVQKSRLLQDVDPKEAHRAAERATEVNPRDASAWKLLGYLHYRAGNHEPALAAMQAAIDANPDDAASHLNIAFVLRAAGRIDDALARMEEFVARFPDDQRGPRWLADLHYARGEADLAVSALEAAYERFDADPASAIALADGLRRLAAHRSAAGDPSGTREAVERGLALLEELDGTEVESLRVVLRALNEPR